MTIWTRRFYDEHIEADAMHEQLLRAADVVFGIQAAELLDDHLADHAMTAWSRSETSLRRPLPEHAGPW